jgi:hypothetical protein
MNINPNAQDALSQNKAILHYMQEGHSITFLDAFLKFQCMNLKGRIFDIKKDFGVNADREFIRLDNGKRVMKYWIKKDE